MAPAPSLPPPMEGGWLIALIAVQPVNHLRSGTRQTIII